MVGFCENPVPINCVEVLDYPRILFSKRILLHRVKNSMIQDRDKCLALAKIHFP